MTRFTSTVRDLSHKGLGVVDHPDGRVLFVRGTWPGDSGEFEVADDARKYSEAQLVTLISSSPDRVPVTCAHRGTAAGQCGGCPWMMATYLSQLSFKTKRLLHALQKRNIDLSRTVVHPIIPSPRVLGYRNRIQLKTTGEEIGFVSEGSNVFAPIRECSILNKKLHSLFHEVRESLPREDWRPSGGHAWCFVDLDDELEAKDIVLNRRRPFRQGNSEQNEVMRAWLKEQFSRVPGHWPVMDIFSGSGNFTEVISSLGFSNVLAVEVQGSALEELRRRELPGVRVLPLDIMSKGSWAQVARAQPHAKAAVVDPPREGIDKRRSFLKALDNLERLFYISCELDTFARDASDLIIGGFELEEITPIDLFPHTPHVEIMSVFSRAPRT